MCIPTVPSSKPLSRRIDEKLIVCNMSNKLTIGIAQRFRATFSSTHRLL